MAARNQQKLLLLDCSDGSRPSDGGGGGRGGGHPDSEVTGGSGVKKIFSDPRASFCSKNNGGRAPRPPPLDPPLDCYHSPSGLSRGRACYVRASAFALCADKKHATCSPARLRWTPIIPSPSFKVGYEKVNSVCEFITRGTHKHSNNSFYKTRAAQILKSEKTSHF